MNWDISHHIDIIVYAVVAAVLLGRLWSAFGKRNDEDPQRPNPFVTPAPGARDEEDTEVLPGRVRPGNRQKDGENRDGDLARRPFAPVLVAPASLAGGLEQVKQIDRSFDEKQFLQTARTIFSSVVESFAKGDLSSIASLLGPEVRPHFEQAVAARKSAGQTLQSRIARIKDAEVAVAKIENNRALITVNFVSEQENILRGADGAVISGVPGQLEEIADSWVFARDAKSDWIVAETR